MSSKSTPTAMRSAATHSAACGPLPPPQAAPVLPFLLVKTLAEDKRFELLRASPTRFPILLLTVRRRSGRYVTRHDRTQRTVPAAAERLRMRRRLRRTATARLGEGVPAQHVDVRG